MKTHAQIILAASLLLNLAMLADQSQAQSIAQQAYVKASNTGPSDGFGVGTAVWADTMVIGANSEGSSAKGVNGNQSDNNAIDSGASYVFVRAGTNWTQQAYLKASNTDPGDAFGTSVAICGDTLVVGAFEEDSSAAGVNGNQNDNNAADSGAVYVFVRYGTNWTQQAYLKASNPDPNDWFGVSVAISGETVVVGAYAERSSATGVNGNQADNNAALAGAAYVFVRNGTNWSQQAYLKASNTDVGDEFGGAVTISGNTIVVGAPYERSSATGVNGNQSDNNAINAGAAYVFVRNGTNWTQQAYLKASNTGPGDNFGEAVAISADTVVIGAYLEDSNALGVNGAQTNNNAIDAGAAYVFVRNGTNWTQQAYLKASNTDPGDNFGARTSISGDTIVVGAWREDSNALGVNGVQTTNNATDAGAAYVFERTGTNWAQTAYLKPSNTDPGDFFGYVAISGGTVVVGARLEDSSATGINGNQTDNNAFAAGAAYVFTVPDLRIAREGSGFVLRMNGVPDFLYQLQHGATLPNSWTNIATNAASLSGIVDFHTTNQPAGRGFYRTARQ